MEIKDGIGESMKISDFKEITKEHIETCKQIIKLDGWCDEGNNYQFCRKCPFHSSNAKNGKSCFENKYKMLWAFPQDDIVEASKQFIEQFENIYEYIINIKNDYKEQIIELKNKIRALENIIRKNQNGKTVVEIEIEERERLEKKREHDEHLLWRKHHGNGRGIFL